MDKLEKQGYWYHELERIARNEGYIIEEKGEFVIGENFIFLKHPNGKEITFVLKGYNPVKGGYYEKVGEE